MRKHFRAPPFAKNAEGGAPILLVMPAKSKPGHPPPSLVNIAARHVPR